MAILIIASAISILLTGVYLLVMFYFIRGWRRIAIPYDLAMHEVKVSVIVAARNEEANIARTLDALLGQSYPASLYEVIVINDHSTDNTAAIVSSYGEQGIKLINFTGEETLNAYKKAAISMAISQATGTLIVTTDADCVMGTEWLKTIVAYYAANPYKLISCPVAYHEEKSLFERLQTLEFSSLIGLGAATIGNGTPSTCNGANLVYERQAFLEVGGFTGIDDLASGDDELLLQKIVKRYKGSVGFLKHTAAIVYTTAKPTLNSFIDQRKRWASKSTRYENKGMIALGVVFWLFNLSMLINLFAGFFYFDLFLIVVLQLLLKILLEFAFLNDITMFFKRRKLLILIPLLSILHVVYLVYIGIAGNTGTYQWKGRTVR